jgi:hypothetical protein
MTIILNAQDIVNVQTLEFNDITKRRGIYKFPDNDDTYRKILMYYTLKCDRQTAQDIFECGEWDYLAHCQLYQHTGIMDSTLVNSAKYNWGRGIPNKLYFTTEPTYTKKIKKYQDIKIDNTISENEFVIGTGSSEMTFGNKPTKFQILLSKDYMKENNIIGKTISRLALFNKGEEVTVKNFKIQYLLSASKNISKFETGNFTTAYEGSITFPANTKTIINLSNTFKSSSLQGVVLQFSYDEIVSNAGLILASDDISNCILTETTDKFLEFDKIYDYTFSKDLPELRNIKKFTIEFWYRLNSWGGSIMQISNALDFRMAEEYRQPKRYYISMSDSIGYGVMVGGVVDFTSTWNHFAFVYDATKEQYGGRIKFYINGNETTTNIRGIFPNAINDLEHILKLNTESNNSLSDMDEFRLWTDALPANTIKNWLNNSLDNTHPNYNNLLVYYTMDNIENYQLLDNSGNNNSSTLIGTPIQRDYPIELRTKNQIQAPTTPQLWLYEGNYEANSLDYYDTLKIYNSPKSLITYQLIDKNVKIKDIQYVWEPGTFYVLNEDNLKIDSMIVTATDSLMQDTIKYYSKPTEKLNTYELARFITPYGLNMTLGPEGFTWIYDVTEYASLLKGDVDLSAHNQQELIDLRFEFYKGVAPRDVLKINRPWGEMSSISYKDLSNNTRLNEQTINLLPDTKSVMMRARLTGHGHNSNDGNFPHCCEWKNNTHYILVNAQETSNFSVWRHFECGFNPVFPQGGTWNGQREGWCPGDVVYNYDFDISEYIKDNRVSVDYDITPVPENNLGMGSGNYVVAMHLFEYAEANHYIDAEIYEVITPNNIQYYSRMNPICANPNIVIRNNGVSDLTSLNFTYQVSGGTSQVYQWSGLIKPMAKDTIELPIETAKFWVGDAEHEFTVNISSPNGAQDEYTVNDSYTTKFNMPDLYNHDMVIWYQTNAEPQYYTYEIKDMSGNVVFDKKNLSAGQLYKDEIILPDGCYTLEFFSLRHTGLSYWAYAGQGSGSFRIYNKAGQLLKSFNPDFGVGIIYSFDLGGVLDVQDPGYENLLDIYPNPAEDNLTLSLDYFTGMAELEVYEPTGKLVYNEKVFVYPSFSKTIDLSGMAKGTYIIRIVNKEFDIIKKFVKK